MKERKFQTQTEKAMEPRPSEPIRITYFSLDGKATNILPLNPFYIY